MKIVKHENHYTYGGVVVRKHEVTGIKTLGYAYAIVSADKKGRLVRTWHPCRLNRAVRNIENDLKLFGGEIRNGEIWTEKAIATTKTV